MHRANDEAADSAAPLDGERPFEIGAAVGGQVQW
jgi:hypothetical protein